MERTQHRATKTAWLMACLALSGCTYGSSSNGGTEGDQAALVRPTSTAPAGQSNPQSYEPPGFGTSCELRFMEGPRALVPDCDDYLCASMLELQDCEDDEQLNCNPVTSCTCEHQSSFHSAEVVKDDDTYLSGVPNFWQFDYGCAHASPITALLGLGAYTLAELAARPENALGCAPVAGAEMMYWWAQRGYSNLVSEHLDGPGTGPENRPHDWMELTQELYDDYFYTLCVPFGQQTAVPQGSMANGLREYVQDAGYDVSVNHYKVCDDCSAKGTDELQSDEGLSIIKAELRAGRPVVMGFNVGRALDPVIPLIEDADGDGHPEVLMVSAGALSNGTPIFGTISHYGVITGYREVGGQDVVLVNLGWGEGTEEFPFLWNPAGKWVHLYTMNILSKAGGAEWCSIDRGLGNAFLDSEDIGVAEGDDGTLEQIYAGNYCGIDRDEQVITESGTYTWETGYYCDLRTTLMDVVGREDDPRITNLESGSAVILERQEELPR